MNQRKLKKQLLLQRIAAQRAQIRLELQDLRHEFSPMKELSDVSSDLTSVLGGLTPIIAVALRRSDASRWLRYGLTVTLPVAIMVLTWKGPKR